MFYRDLGTDYSHFNGFLWEINARKTNFSPYKHSLGTNYVREPRYHCIRFSHKYIRFPNKYTRFSDQYICFSDKFIRFSDEYIRFLDKNSNGHMEGPYLDRHMKGHTKNCCGNKEEQCVDKYS